MQVSGFGLWVCHGYLNTEPNKVFGALGLSFFLFGKEAAKSIVTTCNYESYISGGHRSS